LVCIRIERVTRFSNFAEKCLGSATGNPQQHGRKFLVSLTGNSGDNSAWVITDDIGNILALPPAGPFDLEGAGEGVCLIYHLSYEDGLSGLMMGNTTADLAGCFSFSNPITVTRETSGSVCFTSNEEVSVFDDISLYPNPVSNQLILELNITNGQVSDPLFSIVSMAGQLVHQEAQPIFSGRNTLEFNVSGLPAGLYIISIATENEVVQRKFVKTE
ncbi:MAG: T9SS type A sorting domain-containing protein, partial [Bacteroidota bacterium]